VKFSSVLLATFGLVVALLPASAAAPPDDRAAIEAVVRDYLEGWYTGDAARMERALHPELVKRMIGVEPKSGRSFLEPIGASGMVAFTAAGAGKLKPGTDAGIEVTVFDVFRDIATAKGRSAHFMDYVQLGRFGGEWKIVNVLWQPLAPPPPPPPAKP
jgi:hypothetical protein